MTKLIQVIKLTWKKGILILLVISMLSIIFGWVMPVFAGDSIVAVYNLGPEVDETAVTGTLYSDGLLVIEGSWPMGDYYVFDSPLYSDRTQIKSVTISNEVTTIGSYVFYRCSALTSITIPGGVTSIGDGAFYRCESLATVTFANDSKIPAIPTGTFSDCTALTSGNMRLGVAVPAYPPGKGHMSIPPTPALSL